MAKKTTKIQKDEHPGFAVGRIIGGSTNSSQKIVDAPKGGNSVHSLWDGNFKVESTGNIPVNEESGKPLLNKTALSKRSAQGKVTAAAIKKHQAKTEAEINLKKATNKGAIKQSKTKFVAKTGITRNVQPATKKLYELERSGEIQKTKTTKEFLANEAKRSGQTVHATDSIGLVTSVKDFKETERIADSSNPRSNQLGIVGYKPKAKSVLPSRQSALKKTKFSTGDFWHMYTKRNFQNVSDLKRIKNAKKLTGKADFVEGTNDPSTSDEQWRVNNAVNWISMQGDKKTSSSGKVIRAKADELPSVSFKTPEGVITMPKTYDLNKVKSIFGISSKTSQSGLRHKIQRKISKIPELEEKRAKSMGLKGDDLPAGVVPSLSEVSGQPAKPSFQEKPAELELAPIYSGISSMKTFQKAYAKPLLDYQDKEELDAKMKLGIHEATNPDVTVRFGAKAGKMKFKVGPGHEDKLQTRADVLAGKKSMTIVKNDESGQPVYSNTIKPASDSERLVVYDKEARKPKVVHTGNPNPIKSIQKDAPQYGGGHKMFYDLSGIKAAEDSGVGLDQAIKDFETKHTLSLNANNAKKNSQQQMKVEMQEVSGDEVRSTPGALKQLIKSTSNIKPEIYKILFNNTTPGIDISGGNKVKESKSKIKTAIESGSTENIKQALKTHKKNIKSASVKIKKASKNSTINLSNTILNEDVAEFGKVKLNPSPDAPLAGNLAEVAKRHTKKSSRK